MRARRIGAGLVLASVALAACDGAAPANSPEGVFAQARKALEREDYGAFFDQLAQENRAAVLNFVVRSSAAVIRLGDDEAARKAFAVEGLELGPGDLAPVFERHGIANEEALALRADSADTELAKLVLAGDERARALFADLAGAWSGKGLRAFGERGDLVECVVEGDHARGTVERVEGDTLFENEIRFVRRDGVWKIAGAGE